MFVALWCWDCLTSCDNLPTFAAVGKFRRANTDRSESRGAFFVGTPPPSTGAAVAKIFMNSGNTTASKKRLRRNHDIFSESNTTPSNTTKDAPSPAERERTPRGARRPTRTAATRRRPSVCFCRSGESSSWRQRKRKRQAQAPSASAKPQRQEPAPSARGRNGVAALPRPCPR